MLLQFEIIIKKYQYYNIFYLKIKKT